MEKRSPLSRLSTSTTQLTFPRQGIFPPSHAHAAHHASKVAAFETPMLERNRRSGRGNGCLLATADYIAIRTLSLAFPLTTEGVRRTTAKDVCYRMYLLSNKRSSKALILLSSESGGIHLQCIHRIVVPRNSIVSHR
jgi:hypothetical protein